MSTGKDVLHDIRNMQIKTAMKYHHKPIRWQKNSNTDNINCWQGCGATGTLIQGMKNSSTTLKDSLAVSYSTKDKLTIQSSKHTPGYSSKGVENLCLYKNLHTDVYMSFIHNCQSLEASKISFRRGMDG